MPVYLDTNATTATDPRVAEVVCRYLVEDYGNAGSRTHAWGVEASKAVETARQQVAAAVGARPDEVTFTSGATEANNIALLGLADHAEAVGKRHIIATAVEHKAVLEPLQYLEKARGFSVTLLPVDDRGYPTPESLVDALRDDTVAVSTMQVNNETGVEMPLADYAEVLAGHDAHWHVDAAQGFGKRNGALTNPRIDIVAVSGHKVFAPKGIGALIARRRGYSRLPLTPLMYGGGQERGLRPGTLPVALIAGLGLASELASSEAAKRAAACAAYREEVLSGLVSLDPIINGDPDRALPHILNVTIPGTDAEAVMVATKDLVAISNGSACTSSTYQPSHVLLAMGYDDDHIAGALRISWDHNSPPVDWSVVVSRLAGFAG